MRATAREQILANGGGSPLNGALAPSRLGFEILTSYQEPPREPTCGVRHHLAHTMLFRISETTLTVDPGVPDPMAYHNPLQE